MAAVREEPENAEVEEVVKREEIAAESFDEPKTDPNLAQTTNKCWRLVIDSADSREAAGGAVCSALFDSAPNPQSFFTNFRAVQAMCFCMILPVLRQ
eukprot:11689078-Karenia_brevis.AAC.1